MTVVRPGAICRHCRDPKRSVNRPRGLCWVCYYTPGVRGLYHPVTRYGRRGIWAEQNPPDTLPPVPTDTVPTTPDRVLVYARRAELGVALHHPEDKNDHEKIPTRLTKDSCSYLQSISGRHRARRRWHSRKT